MTRLLVLAAVTNPLTWVAALVALLLLSVVAAIALGLFVAWCWWNWTVESGPARNPGRQGGEPTPPAVEEPRPVPEAVAVEDVVTPEPPATVAVTAAEAVAVESTPELVVAVKNVVAVAVTKPARKSAKPMTMMERRGPILPPVRKPGWATLRAEAARLGVPDITRGMRAESIARKIAEFQAA